MLTYTYNFDYAPMCILIKKKKKIIYLIFTLGLPKNDSNMLLTAWGCSWWGKCEELSIILSVDVLKNSVDLIKLSICTLTSLLPVMSMHGIWSMSSSLIGFEPFS